MKHTRVWMSWLICLVLVCSACIVGAAGAEEEITLVFSAGDCFGDGEQQKPQEEWTISKLLRQFEAENPGVKVELQIPADTQASHTTFKTSASVGNAPDVANLWSGMNILSFKDQLLCLNDYIPEEDMQLFENANACRENLDPNGDIYAYPFMSKNSGFFLYNKKIVAEAGLDFEANPPRTMDEFYAACEAIKAAGYIPLYEDQEGQMFDYGAALWWQQGQTPETMVQEGLGNLKFADDPALIAALEAYAELYKRGYMNENISSTKDKVSQFYSGKAAIISGGTWSISGGREALGDDFGVMHFPDISADARVKDTSMGGIGETLCIPRTTKYPELAVKLCSFLNSRESSLAILKVMGGIPLRSDITPADIGWEGDALMEKVYKWGQGQLCPFPPSIVGSAAFGVLNGMSTKILTGEMTPLQVAQLADETVEMQ